MINKKIEKPSEMAKKRLSRMSEGKGDAPFPSSAERENVIIWSLSGTKQVFADIFGLFKTTNIRNGAAAKVYAYFSRRSSLEMFAEKSEAKNSSEPFPKSRHNSGGSAESFWHLGTFRVARYSD